MSKLFSCVSCTKKNKKHKLHDCLEDDKMPKERNVKQKKGKEKKIKDKTRKGEKSNIENNQELNNQKQSFDKNQAHIEVPNAVNNLKLVEVHKAENNKVKSDDNCSKGDASTPERIDLQKKIVDNLDQKKSDENVVMNNNNNNNRHVPQIIVGNEQKRKDRENRNSLDTSDNESDGSDDGSCLTDSDLNISEAVFISEQGPRVNSIGLSLSRGGIQTIRATLENERLLEKELLDRVSISNRSKKNSTMPNLSLSLDSGSVSKEERNF